MFTAPAPDVAWCGDMTEIVTGDGKLYLAVIDLYSRRILGYAMGEHHDAALVVAALNMAAVTRGGHVAGVIFHSDRGSEEYTSAEVARACARWKVRQSMRRVGSCFDNAVAEATFSTIKVEYAHRRQFRTRAEAQLKIATWITDFYNHRRHHSACDGLSPINYERSTTRALEVQAEITESSTIPGDWQARAVIAATILRQLHAVITTGRAWDLSIAAHGTTRPDQC